MLNQQDRWVRWLSVKFAKEPLRSRFDVGIGINVLTVPLVVNQIARLAPRRRLNLVNNSSDADTASEDNNSLSSMNCVHEVR